VFDITASFSVGEIEVMTTDHRGLSVEEVAKRAMDKILHVSKDSPEPIREQALALKETMYEAILFYMKYAVNQDRATIAAKLRGAGYPELAANIRNL
jgi:hypothetical protein